MNNTKTTVVKGSNVDRKWHFIDLDGLTLGRACTKIASILMGKDNVDFSFHRDDGDYVVAVNASKIKVTGKKEKDKMYHHHTAWSGHLKSYSFQELLARDAREVIMRGVSGMLPKNKLRDRRLTRLKVFVGAEHTFADKLAK